ncbi:MerR family transcriptional regulator [Frankia sp. Ag45/Mut15]|uniref:MerR family transcriptional regulator n=1 Tax=Frankia umida TaxID=573489 RepID=A0ABT0JUP4_9ACTN|nr:MerR family transcriptional regulator [Frankia umida]MCK9875239.1 MerR family transcriptional regulator [Frankia umida]
MGDTGTAPDTTTSTLARSAAATTPSGPGRDLRGIGQAAQELGVSIRALRYYQEMGLITPSGRTAGGNRLYAEEDLDRVRRIRELQTLLGFNLDEIRLILASEDRLVQVRVEYRATSDDGDRMRLLIEAQQTYERLRGEVSDKIRRLEAFRGELDERLARNQQVRSAVVHARTATDPAEAAEAVTTVPTEPTAPGASAVPEESGRARPPAAPHRR